MNIILKPEMEQFIKEQLRNGRYFSVSEVVEEALQLLEAQQQIHQMTMDKIRQQVAIGIEQADKGEVFDGQEVIKELYDKIEHISQFNQ